MSSEVTVEGIIVAVDWDSSGKAIAVVLNTVDERELRLEGLSAGGRSLDSLLGALVRATGRIRPVEALSVSRYEVLKPGQDPSL